MEVERISWAQQCAVSVQEWEDAAFEGKWIREDRLQAFVAEAADMLVLSYGGFRVLKRDDGEVDFVINPQKVDTLLEKMGVVPQAGASKIDFIENRIRCAVHEIAFDKMLKYDKQNKKIHSQEFLKVTVVQKVTEYALKRGVKDFMIDDFLDVYRWAVSCGLFMSAEYDTLMFYGLVDRIIIKYAETCKISDNLTNNFDVLLQHNRNVQCVLASPDIVALNKLRKVMPSHSDSDLGILENSFIEPRAGADIVHLDPFGSYVKGETVLIKEKKYPVRLNKKLLTNIGEEGLKLLLTVVSVDKQLKKLDMKDEANVPLFLALSGKALDSVIKLGCLRDPIGSAKRPSLRLRIEYVAEVVCQNFDVTNPLFDKKHSITEWLDYLDTLVGGLEKNFPMSSYLNTFQEIELERFRIALFTKILDVSAWKEILTSKNIARLVPLLVQLYVQGKQIHKNKEIVRSFHHNYSYPFDSMEKYVYKIDEVVVKDVIVGLVEMVSRVDCNLGLMVNGFFKSFLENPALIDIVDKNYRDATDADWIVMLLAIQKSIGSICEKYNINAQYFECIVSQAAHIGLCINFGFFDVVKEKLKFAKKKFTQEFLSRRFFKLFGIVFPRLGGITPDMSSLHVPTPTFAILPLITDNPFPRDFVVPSATYLMQISNIIKRSSGLQQFENSWYSYQLKAKESKVRLKIIAHTTGSLTYGVDTYRIVDIDVGSFSKEEYQRTLLQVLYHIFEFTTRVSRVEVSDVPHSAQFVSASHHTRVTISMLERLAKELFVHLWDAIGTWSTDHGIHWISQYF